MADENVASYGYEDDEVKVSLFNFGLNAGKTYLKEFKYTPNGGKDGAEQDALEIIFTINGQDKGYRQFPVTKAFLKDNKGETTDPTTPEFKAAVTSAGAIITHIVSCFLDRETYKSATSKRFVNWKDFIDTVTNLLPKNFSSIPLDIFMQWQYQISPGQNRTYLDIPKNMKGGYWLSKAQEGDWKEVLVSKTPKDNDEDVFFYYDASKGKKDESKGDVASNFVSVHPFTRRGYFVNSKNFTQQVEAGSTSEGNIPPSNGTTDGAPVENKPAAVW